jgi:hypothetical protein
MTFVANTPWILRKHCGLGREGRGKYTGQGKLFLEMETVWIGYPIFWHRLHSASRVASESCGRAGPWSRRSVRFLGPWWRRGQFRIGRRGFSFGFFTLGILSGGGAVFRLIFGLGLVFSTV